MTGYIIRRVLWTIPVLWAIATITFFLMHAVPGGPFDRDRELPPPIRANLERKYGLDDPLPEQYVTVHDEPRPGRPWRLDARTSGR